ncbi:hypothetical protein AAG570_004205, partial [Ranatra chinensis]
QRFSLLTWLVLVVVLCGVVAAQGGTGGILSDETLETVLNDKRYLTRQLKCALGEGPCDSVGRRLKGEYTIRHAALGFQCPLEIYSVKKCFRKSGYLRNPNHHTKPPGPQSFDRVSVSYFLQHYLNSLQLRSRQ